MLRHTLLIIVFLCGFSGMIRADIITLKNNRQIKGRIIAERSDKVKILDNFSVMDVSRNSIRTISRGFTAEQAAEQAQSYLELGKFHMAQGDTVLARQVFEAGIKFLKEDTENLDKLPDSVTKVEKSLQLAFLASFPEDPQTKRIRQELNRAMDLKDKLRLDDAYKAFKGVMELAPERTDIQYQFGEVCEALGRKEEALTAFQQLVDEAPKIYYLEVAPTLKNLYEEQGRELLVQGAPAKALGYFRKSLAFDAPKNEEALADMEEYAEQLERIEKEPPEETSLAVYRYAAEQDLVDLAFYALQEVEKVQPDHPVVQEKMAEQKYLFKYQENMKRGNYEEAVRLKQEKPEALRNNKMLDLKEAEIEQKYKPRMEELEKEVTAKKKETEAGRLLKAGTEALEQKKFSLAAEHLKRLTSDFSEQPEAAEAAPHLEKALMEKRARELLEAGHQALRHKEFRKARNQLSTLAEAPGFEESEFQPVGQKLLARVALEEQADTLLEEARDFLDKEEMAPALRQLEKLEENYGNTMAGTWARKWLRNYRQELASAVQEQEMVNTRLFEGAREFPESRVERERGRLKMQVRALPQIVQEAMAENTSQVHKADEIVFQDTRNPVLYILAPLLAGVVLALAGLFWLEKGRRKKNPCQLPDSPEAQKQFHDCRMCGLPFPKTEKKCPHCAAPTGRTKVESNRDKRAKHDADANPWDIRLNYEEQQSQEFKTTFSRCEQLRYAGKLEEAVDCCREALRIDQFQPEAFLLLAELLEDLHQKKSAISAYREYLYLQPTDSQARAKLQELQGNLTDEPLQIDGHIMFLSGALWWIILWLSIGLSPQLILLRALFCLLGFWFTVKLWKKRQEKRRLFVTARRDVGTKLDNEPFPDNHGGWKAQSHQALKIARLIREHTGVAVPDLSPRRLLYTFLLSLAFLAGLLAIAWTGHAPLVLIGWPGAVLLIFYLMELYPRMLTGHVLLRHFFEETFCPWADHKRPFQPPQSKNKGVGEFLVHSFRELPFRWALAPAPYEHSRQGILNSVQQTLNRHWDLHRHYSNLRCTRDFSMVFPAGFRALNTALWLLLALTVLFSVFFVLDTTHHQHQYIAAIEQGRNAFLQGNLERAHQKLAQAIALEPSRQLPYLLKGHAFAALEMEELADRYFRTAVARSRQEPVAFNDYANFLQRHGHFAQAIVQYKKALEISPKNADIMNNIGAAYLKMGNLTEARRFLTQAIIHNPRHGRAHTTLGYLFEQQGNKKMARKHYEKALEVAPGLSYTDLARSRLRRNLAPSDAIPFQIPETYEEDKATSQSLPRKIEDGPTSPSLTSGTQP